MFNTATINTQTLLWGRGEGLNHFSGQLHRLIYIR